MPIVTDCHHEVRPIEAGYRVVLTYNLMLEGSVISNLARGHPDVLRRMEAAGLIEPRVPWDDGGMEEIDPVIGVGLSGRRSARGPSPGTQPCRCLNLLK
jgi:hypothetical protein